jgi:F0F1-type ATP synthase assembly protein I
LARRAGKRSDDRWAAAVSDMPEDDSGLFLARSLKFLQENIRRSGPAATASYTLIGAILLLGGIGYALDRWIGTTVHWFLFAGLMLGIVVGFYELAKSVWHK